MVVTVDILTQPRKVRKYGQDMFDWGEICSKNTMQPELRGVSCLLREEESMNSLQNDIRTLDIGVTSGKWEKENLRIS